MFKNKFDNLDKEIIITIEEFINCGLNISDTAKNLYIHRNTLIYRLDKIYKDTNFDLRNFKDAIVFYVVFLLWKERV
nr:helix-turn-helix domain-containing protein [Clostridium pascui]